MRGVTITRKSQIREYYITNRSYIDTAQFELVESLVTKSPPRILCRYCLVMYRLVF